MATNANAVQTALPTLLTLGRYQTAAGGTGEPFGGQMDELQIYARDLTAAEVARLAAPAPPTLSGMLGSLSVALSWTASAGASSYNVYRSTTSGGPYTRIASGEPGSSYLDSGLLQGVPYFYVVTAVGIRESPNSNEISTTASFVPDLKESSNGDNWINDSCGGTTGPAGPWSAAAMLAAWGLLLRCRRRQPVDNK